VANQLNQLRCYFGQSVLSKGNPDIDKLVQWLEVASQAFQWDVGSNVLSDALLIPHEFEVPTEKVPSPSTIIFGQYVSGLVAGADVFFSEHFTNS
jgi:hypothetical protein